MEHVAGYTVANNLTARTLQGEDREKKYPWFRSEEPRPRLPARTVPRAAGSTSDLADLRVTCHVNGELRPGREHARLRGRRAARGSRTSRST